MRSISNITKNPGRWIQVVVLVIGGAFSFAFAIFLQSQLSSEDATIVQAADRPITSSFVSVQREGRALPRSQPEELETPTSQLRLNKMVVRDPFGPLTPDLVIPDTRNEMKPVESVERRATKVSRVVVNLQALPVPVLAAPPLPFTATGYIQGPSINKGVQQIFLQFADELIVARKGDVVANAYRIEEITSKGVVFTYLPLAQKQSLPLEDHTR